MPAASKVIVPVWITKEPTETDWELIRSHSYTYVEELALKG